MQRYVSFFDNYLHEDIIRVDDYFKDIEKVCNNFKKFFKKDKGIDFTCSRLSILLKKFKIEFIPQSYIEKPKSIMTDGGFNMGSIDHETFKITLYCNENIRNIYNDYEIFKNGFYSVLKHELIHRSQYLKIEYHTLRNLVDRKNPDIDKIYLNDKHELMSFAWQIVDSYRILGATKEDILQLLRKPTRFHQYQNSLLTAFVFAHNKKVVTDESLKLLYKYAFMYANEE